MDKEKKRKLRDVQDVLELIGGRWRGVILALLCEQPKRFSEIKKELEKITPRMLTQELRFLEMNKMLIRKSSEVAENAVLYELTKHGESVKPLIDNIDSWAVNHRKLILKTMNNQ
jgi:DNA-binding HxlR family transcriptional regulator